MELKVHVNPVGKADGYEDYQNEYYDDKGYLIGHSSYDKKQGLHVGAMLQGGKNLYGKTPEGIAFKMQSLLKTHD